MYIVPNPPSPFGKGFEKEEEGKGRKKGKGKKGRDKRKRKGKEMHPPPQKKKYTENGEKFLSNYLKISYFPRKFFLNCCDVVP